MLIELSIQFHSDFFSQPYLLCQRLMNPRTLLRHLTVRFYLSLLIIGILTITTYLAHPELVSAQSLTGLDTEISTLRSEINILRSQVRRLEGEVNRLRQSISRSPGQSTPTPSPSTLNTPPTVVEGQIRGRSDPMFQQLATLVIELKQDVRELQENIRDLQKRLLEVETPN